MVNMDTNDEAGDGLIGKTVTWTKFYWPVDKGLDLESLFEDADGKELVNGHFPMME
jgi:hypothetical protein